MPKADQIQRIIDRGRGVAAKVLGVPYAVYRLGTSTAARNFIDPNNLIHSGYPVYYVQKPASGFRGSFEGTNLKVPLFDIIADMIPFQTGDVFISTDSPYPQGFGAGATRVAFPTLEIDGWCFAFHGPIKKSIGARLDRLAYVYQQATAPDLNGYLSADTTTQLPLIMKGGAVKIGVPLGSVGYQPPTLIPIGMASSERWRGDLYKAPIPTTTSDIVYFAYVPPLQGFTFREGDRLVLQDGSRYVVKNPYEQMVGFVGSQLVLSREIAQT
jgi:hypothetical protein